MGEQVLTRAAPTRQRVTARRQSGCADMLPVRLLTLSAKVSAVPPQLVEIPLATAEVAPICSRGRG